MYFLVRYDTDTYITIHKEDKESFEKICNSNLFKYPNRFILVDNKNDIKKILEDKYSSKNRGGEYITGLPSTTLISSSLFPYNLDSRSPDNKIALLKWNNDIELSDIQSQKIKNKLSTDSGTYIHKILELALSDKTKRIFDRKNNIKEYIDRANSDKEIINMIANFEERKKYFSDMAEKTLSKFFYSELPNIDSIFNEIFLFNKGIQGSIDMLNYENGKLYISDFKTSKKSCSRNQIPEKGYLRQLYIYSRMLLNLGIISKKEYENLGFKIYFFNWNSGNSAVYEYDKSEIDKSKNYCEFILNWYYQMRDMNIEAKDVI